MRRTVFTAALVAAALAVTGVVPGVAAPPPVARSAPTTASEKSVLDIARESGRPVAVPEETTEAREVLANPDGSFTMRSYATPQRVKRDGKWVPIDTSLRANADGTVSPVATVSGLKFSGGGTGPVITLAEPGGKVAFSWPTALPKPALDANKATYEDVYPGVDLVVSANPVGYSHVLVVHDAKAAANPALRDIKLQASTEGVTLDSKDGVLSARDAKGRTVFSGSTPVMWDGEHNERSGPAPTAEDPGGSKVTKLDVTTNRVAAQTELSIKPNLEALSGKDVTYPVYIDPKMNGGQQAWGEVTANGYYYFNADMYAQVGKCWDGEGQCGSLTVARSYFRLDTSPLKKRNGFKATVFSAEMWFTQVWGANKCTAQPVTLTKAGYFDGGLRWGNQPLGADLDTRSSGAGVQCNNAPGGVKFDNEAVKAYAQESANNDWSSVHMALKAPNEGYDLQWKKFGTAGGTAPHFDVIFNFQPNDATDLGVSNAVGCTGVAITPDAQPTLHATASDNNNPPLNVNLHFDVWNSTGTVWKAGGAVTAASGTQGAWKIPSALGDGDYAFRVTVSNNFPGDAAKNLWSPGWSYWYWFRIQATPITAAPAIVSSADYPNGYWGAPQGAPGAIAVNAGGANNISGYTYSFTGSGTAPIPNTQTCNYTPTGSTTATYAPASATGPTWLPIPEGLTTGYHTLHVRSFDDAHNASPETAHVFYVAPNTGQTTRRYEAESLPASQPAGQGRPLIHQDNCCSYTWSGGKQLMFQGNGTGQSFSVTFDVTGEADYQIAVGLTKANDYGQVAFTLDGQAIGQPDVDKPVGSFDAYNPKVINALTQFGIRHLTTGTHTLTGTLTGTNPNAVGEKYYAGLDHITLTKTTRYEAELPAQVTTSQPNGQNVPLTVEQQTANNGGPWSQGAQLLFAAPDNNKTFDLNFSVPAEADYALGIALSKKENRGKLKIAVDGIALMRTDSDPWDGYQASGGRTAHLALGGAHLKAGQHKLTITVVGKNDASSGFTAGVDYLTAVAINNVTATSFTDAMNNRGRATDNVAAADLDFNNNSLSTNSLAAAGLQPGTKVTYGRATFTIPAANAAGNDNVVAMGQTIPLPAEHQVKATAIGLLAVSTCGDTAPSTATVTYTDGTTSNPVVPAVPDWINGPEDTTAVTLSHWANGAAPGTAKPKVYVALAPVDPTKTLASITLPNTGTAFMSNTCGPAPALHVLSMAPAPVAPGWLGAWAQPMTQNQSWTSTDGRTLRMILRPSERGQNMRVRLSNTTADVPNTILRATVAAHTGEAAATLATPVALRFNGSESVTIPAGGEVYSDPVAFPDMTGGTGNLVVSIAIPPSAPKVPTNVTGNQLMYRANGDVTGNVDGVVFGDKWNSLYGNVYFVSGIELSTTNMAEGTVAVLSDDWYSYGPSPGWWPIWTDFLSEALGSKLQGSIAHVGYPRPEKAAAARDRYVLAEPSLRTVIVNMSPLSSTDTLTSARQKLTNLMSASSPAGLRKFSRLDGTPLSIVLCTVPPAGWAETDAREVLRRQLNDEIRNNYTNLGADNFVDFDAAIRDPAAPNKAQASLLTSSGNPNAAFERRLAQTVSDAVDGFPPLTL